MRVERVEAPSAAQWRARAERARRSLWALGEVDARRLNEYVAECEAEARRFERAEEREMASEER